MMVHEELNSIHQQIVNVTAINFPRLTNLYHVAKMAQKLDGVFAECGVYRGGSAYLLLASTNKLLHLFDSFEGLPVATSEDEPESEHFTAPPGKFAVSEERVSEFLLPFSDRVIFHKGWFKDTIPLVNPIQYSLVHLDVDFYQSYKECLDHFVPNIVSGGFLVCDEYSFYKLPGAKKAIDEYFGDVESLDHWHTNIQLTIRL